MRSAIARWAARAHRSGLACRGLRVCVRDLRHAAATIMLRSGLPVHDVSAVLGLSQPPTTLNGYSHVLPGAHERAAAAMDRLLG